MITDRQVRHLRKLLAAGETLSRAAWKTGMDRKTARKYRTGKLPSERAADHVPDVVERGLEGGLVPRVQAVADVGRVLNLNAPQLDVGARSNVDDAELVAVLFDRVGVEPHLVGIDNTVGDLEAHHKLTRSTFASVKHSNVFQSLSK